MKQILLIIKFIAIVLFLNNTSLTAQVSCTDAGFLNVVDFGATPDNPTDNDQVAINLCIETAIDQDKGVYLPPGDYHISGGIQVENDRMECDQFMVITGSTKDANRRTRIILKEGSGTHTVVEGIEFGLNGGTCHGNSGWTDTYHRVLKHIDIKIESDNESAVGVRWRGAEGCGIYDVHVDLTAEPSAIGFQNLPGSGGSTHTISVIGGRIAIDMFPYGDFWEGAQPSPTVSGGYFDGQSEHAISGTWRGMLNLVGCHFKMKNDVLVIKDLRRMGGGGYGGSAGLTDCIIEYESADGNNTTFTPAEYKTQNGFTLTNTYIKYADFLCPDKTAHNPEGWVYYEEVAFDPTTNLSQAGQDIYQGVFIEKTLEVEDDIWVKNNVNDIVPPVNLCAKHKIPTPFPGFEWDGAVCITDFESDVVDGDWSPAFNNAIAQSDIVVVPNGEFMVKNTIHLNSNTKILGLSHERSEIYSSGTRNFDTSTDPYSDPRPIMDTPDDADASCMISDIAINVGMPLNSEAHNPGAVGGYPLLWRAGRNSIIKHIDTRYKSLTHFRDHFTLSKTGSFEDINLTQTNSPVTEGGLIFKTYNKTGVWSTTAVFESAFLLETHDADQRIVTRPFDDVFDYREYDLTYNTPNLTIVEESNGTFDLTSFAIGTADFNTQEDTIFIIGYKMSSPFDTIKVVTNDQNPRPAMQTININWTEMDSVVILANKAFALDDVDASTGSSDFNGITGSDLTYDARITQPMFQHLNINPEVHDKVLITGNGGGRWYNHQLHGKQWLNFNCGFVRIQDTKGKEPIHFYHLHAQHGHQRARVYMDNASHVSIYGTKVELPTSFMRISNSDNIRIFGHGGMTNPIPGHNYYYFENTTNYLVAGIGDQTYTYNNYPGDEFNELTKVDIHEGKYRTMADVTDGVQTDPGHNYKPILWRVGSPETGSQQGCSGFRSLEINNGQKTWEYCVGEEVTIIADQLDCMDFTEWTGYTTSNQDTFTFVMPDQDISMTANYEAKTQYNITVNNGYGSGSYCQGTRVYLYADPAPSGQQFDKWTGDVEYLTSDTATNPVLTVPASEVTLTAAYKVAEIIPEVNITNPAEGDLFQYNEEIVIEATATISSGSVTKVEFYNGETLLGESTSVPYSFTWQYAPDTVSNIQLSAKAYGDNGITNESSINITVNPERSPYLDNPHSIPGIIEAEHYDLGGFDNAYWDDDVFNKWEDFRVNEGVDVQITLDSEGEYNVGYIETGEFMKYTVDVGTTGYYSINFRIASNDGGGQLNIFANDTNVTQTVSIPSTGGWQEWGDYEISEVVLFKGEQTLTLNVLYAGFNLNYLEFTLDSVYTDIPSGIQGKIQNQKSIRVYPNITDDKVFVELDSESGKMKYSIFNSYGQLVGQDIVNETVNCINISNYSSGIYYLIIHSNTKDPQSFKLIKQ